MTVASGLMGHRGRALHKHILWKKNQTSDLVEEWELITLKIYRIWQNTSIYVLNFGQEEKGCLCGGAPVYAF